MEFNKLSSVAMAAAAAMLARAGVKVAKRDG